MFYLVETQLEFPLKPLKLPMVKASLVDLWKRLNSGLALFQ